MPSEAPAICCRPHCRTRSGREAAICQQALSSRVPDRHASCHALALGGITPDPDRRQQVNRSDRFFMIRMPGTRNVGTTTSSTRWPKRLGVYITSVRPPRQSRVSSDLIAGLPDAISHRPVNCLQGTGLATFHPAPDSIPMAHAARLPAIALSRTLRLRGILLLLRLAVPERSRTALRTSRQLWPANIATLGQG
jgi:hypothetical protein